MLGCSTLILGDALGCSGRLHEHGVTREISSVKQCRGGYHNHRGGGSTCWAALAGHGILKAVLASCSRASGRGSVAAGGLADAPDFDLTNLALSCWHFGSWHVSASWHLCLVFTIPCAACEFLNPRCRINPRLFENVLSEQCGHANLATILCKWDIHRIRMDARAPQMTSSFRGYHLAAVETAQTL